MEIIPFEAVHRSVIATLDKFGDIPDQRVFDKGARQEATRIHEIVVSVGRALEGQPAQTLLEVGLGNSMVTTALHDIFGKGRLRLHAVEHPDRELLSREVFRAHLNLTGVSVTAADLGRLPWSYPEESLDIVVFSEVIEHLSPVLATQVIREISRILRPGGIIIVSTPNLGSWKNRWKLLRGKEIFDPALPLDWAGGTYAHIRLYLPGEIGFLFSKFGLATTGTKYMNFGLRNKPLLKRAGYRLVHALLPGLSPDFVMVAEKAGKPAE